MFPNARQKSRGHLLGIGAFFVTLAVVVFSGLGPRSNTAEKLLPHGFCYLWDPALVRLHVVSDALIGLAYIAIPVSLVTFLRKRTDLPFSWMFLLFGLFIVACGATHIMEIWTLWSPDYWLAGSVKALTAAASVPTAILLFMLVPQALAVPSTRQLRESNEALEREAAERQRVERALREAQAGLETRVAERTAELSRANALLEKAHRRQSEFLAILTHELRNPAHAIRASSQYLIMRASDADTRENAEIIVRQVGQLSRLLDDLTSVLRNEYEPARLNKSNLDLRDAVQRGVETVRGLIGERNQMLSVDLPTEPVNLHGDRARLVQAVVSLIRNASLYSDPGAPVAVVLKASDGTARIEVRDRGIGFEGEDAARLFELFARSAEARRRAVGGLGIGLHVAKLIVGAHGGTISAESPGRGAGSVFTVTLPLQEAAK